MKHGKSFSVICSILIFVYIFSSFSSGNTLLCPKCGSERVKHPSKQATCTEDGNNIYYTCSNSDCTYTTLYYTEGDYSNFIPAYGHQLVSTSAVPATCTTDGRTAGEKCTRPGCEYESYTVIQATGHSETTVGKIDSGCITEGNTGNVKCIICGKTLHEGTVIPAKGHTPVKTNGYAPTCEDSGLTDGIYCTSCGNILTEQQEISPLGHITKTTGAKNPTCTKKGSTGTVACLRCNKTIEIAEDIPATGHQFDNGTVTENKIQYCCLTCGYTENCNIDILNGYCRFNAGANADSVKSTVTDGDKTISSSDILKTGFIVSFSNKSYTIAVTGDADCDGIITVLDARIALRQAIGTTHYTNTDLIFNACDYNGDNSVKIADARNILKNALGINK